MFPDYIAIEMLIGNVVFLIFLVAYATRKISKESDRLPAELGKSEERNLLEIYLSSKNRLLKDSQIFLASSSLGIE